MSGLVSPPTPPDESVPLTPAPDVAPESYLTPQQVSDAGVNMTTAIMNDPTVQQLLGLSKTSPMVELFVFLAKNLGKFLQVIISSATPGIVAEGTALVAAVTPLVGTVSDVFGTFTQVYVAEISRHFSMVKGGATVSTGTPVGNVSQVAFDSIVAPIATFLSSADPDTPGSGEKNYQQTLGVIVQIHLATWVINVISNLTGLGVLKYMNSFNTVILAALNARALSRVGMRPYIDTYIATPLTQDLNTKWPIKVPAATSDVKQYIRGALSAGDLQTKMAQLGYNPAVTAQLLLDTAQLMGLTDVAFVVKYGGWTTDQGIEYLQQIGYDEAAAALVLHREVNTVAYANAKASADAMGAYYSLGRVDDSDYRTFLAALGFTPLEIQSYITLYGIQLEFPKLLTYTQVKSLFTMGLVDLDFVRQFLTDNQNAPSDIDLLTLLDFTAAADLQAAKAALGATARVLAVEAAASAAAATAKGNAELAAAYAEKAAAKAAVAAKYGQ